MKPILAAATLALLTACAGGSRHASLTDMHSALDWQNDSGAGLNREYAGSAKAILGKLSRSDAIGALNAAGYECIYGEAHEDYPEPAAQCTRSFATRACQMDWEIFTTADKGQVQDVDATFTRDCVGVDRDWPEPKRSAIDDQLAPASPPQ